MMANYCEILQLLLHMFILYYTVDSQQLVVLTFEVSAKLKSNAAPAQLTLTQKILSNNCGCISQYSKLL